LEIEKAIELLSDYCDRGSVTLDDDFKNAVRMGKSVLVLIASEKVVISAEDMPYLLLNSERRKYVPDPRD